MRKRRKTTFGLHPAVPVMLAGLAAGVLLATRTISRSHQPQVLLPVPTHLSNIALSGPVTLTHLDTSILGAETIDPIDFVGEINKVRAKNGAKPLRLNATLMKAAKMRADVIMKYQNFSHQDPHEGIELLTVLPMLHYRYAYASENIGMGGVSAPDFVNGFMNSTSHRNNLLDPRLTHTGAAIVDGPYYQYYVNVAVQLFAIPGGKDEQLGYTETERKSYEASLATVSSKLNPINRIIGWLTKRNVDYRRLKRQKDILESVLVRIRKSEPLRSEDVALILEYNSLL